MTRGKMRHGLPHSLADTKLSAFIWSVAAWGTTNKSDASVA